MSEEIIPKCIKCGAELEELDGDENIIYYQCPEPDNCNVGEIDVYLVEKDIRLISSIKSSLQFSCPYCRKPLSDVVEKIDTEPADDDDGWYETCEASCKNPDCKISFLNADLWYVPMEDQS